MSVADAEAEAKAAAKAAAERAKWHRQHLLAVRLLTRNGRNTSNFTHKNIERKLRTMFNAEEEARKAAKAAKAAKRAKEEPELLPIEPAWRNAMENRLLAGVKRSRHRTSRRTRRRQRLL